MFKLPVVFSNIFVLKFMQKINSNIQVIFAMYFLND